MYPQLREWIGDAERQLDDRNKGVATRAGRRHLTK
jgi:hypothetical protein